MPKSRLSEVLDCEMNQWTMLTRCLEDGWLGVNSNAPERDILPFVLGRAMYGFSQTPCRMLG